jgi:hypothetical protein
MSKKSTAATLKTTAKKKAVVSKEITSTIPTLTAIVEFNSCRTGETVTRTFEVTKSDINDVTWYGGNSGDYFFDNEFETNEERFEQRLEDCVHYMLWDGETEGQPVDSDLNGDHPNGLDYHDRLSVSWESKFTCRKFYPIKKQVRTK